MKTIVAIVRTTAVENIVQCLEAAGIRGMTMSEVRGLGEQVRIRDPYTVHIRIELIIPDEKVEEISETIVGCAHTGLSGDGLIAVYPMDYMIHIRTNKKLT